MSDGVDVVGTGLCVEVGRHRLATLPWGSSLPPRGLWTTFKIGFAIDLVESVYDKPASIPGFRATSTLLRQAA